MAWMASFGWAPSLSTFYTETAIPNAPKHTGRLPLSDEEDKSSVPAAPLYAPEPFATPAMIKEQIHYRHSKTDLNTAFFSPENVDRLQERIQAAVLQMVNGRIDRQSDADLMMVMRSYYLQYAGNNAEQVEEELQLLNDRVVDFCSNRIAVEVEGYRYYRKDILDFPAPISRPVDTHIYGTRTGELKSFF